MKIRKETVVLIVLIIGLAGYLFLRRSDRTRYDLPALPPVAAGELTRIEISQGGESVILNRKDDRWLIAPQDKPTDPKKVREMLETIEGLTLTALVSESQSYSLYELDEAHRIHVTAWQGEQVRRDFTIGKVAPTFRHTFVMLAGDPRVFHARDAIRHRFNQSAAELRDKGVLAFDRADIQEIRIAREGRTLTLVRAKPAEGGSAGSPPEKPQPGWQTADGAAANSAAVEALLAALSDLKCDRYVPEGTPSEFKNPAATIVLKGSQEHTLSIFAPLKPEDKDQPAVSSGSPDSFFLSEGQLRQVLKKPEELLQPETTGK
jgi:hypothetical protein